MKRSLRNAHASTWKIMAIVIPLILLLATVIRQDPEKLGDPKLIEPLESASTEVKS
ncbi:MAG: hypothetical protein ACR2O8_07405 [Rhizobiaceae bacterium]